MIARHRIVQQPYQNGMCTNHCGRKKNWALSILKLEKHKTEFYDEKKRWSISVICIFMHVSSLLLSLSFTISFAYPTDNKFMLQWMHHTHMQWSDSRATISLTRDLALRFTAYTYRPAIVLYVHDLWCFGPLRLPFISPPFKIFGNAWQFYL